MFPLFALDTLIGDKPVAGEADLRRYTTRFARTAQIVLAAIVVIVIAMIYYVVVRRRRARTAVFKL